MIAMLLINFALGSINFTSVDWVAKGRVTPSRTTGSCCGDEFAETASGLIESLYAQQYGENATEVSIEQLAECNNISFNHACKFGEIWPVTAALQFVQTTGGVSLERDYPTTIGSDCNKGDNPCRFNMPMIPIVFKTINNITNEKHLVERLQHDVVAVNFDASGQGIARYKKGTVYDGTFEGRQDCDPNDAIFPALVVGLYYNQDYKMWAYRVRMNYGTDFADDGFVDIKAGVDTCGISDSAISLS
jgi:hypothetical protein